MTGDRTRRGPRPRVALALAGVALAGLTAVTTSRHVARVRPALRTLDPAFRSPAWYLLHRPHDPSPRAGPWIDHGLCNRLADELGLVVLNVRYRLAPEHPFPAAPDDCYAALAWLHEQADELRVDRARVGVAGGSAGGGLAAAVAQMAHDRRLPVAFQGLVYPMLDDRTVLREDHGGRGTVTWTPEHNRDAWAWYLGHPVREEEDRRYAVPARRADLTGLPPAWVGVGDADLFHDEDVDYARRLEAAGVPVELVTVPGMPHAADRVAGIAAARPFLEAFVAAVGRALATAPASGDAAG